MNRVLLVLVLVVAGCASKNSDQFAELRKFSAEHSLKYHVWCDNYGDCYVVAWKAENERWWRDGFISAGVDFPRWVAYAPSPSMLTDELKTKMFECPQGEYVNGHGDLTDSN